MTIAKKELTDVAIRKAKPPAAGKREIMWDGLVPGFGLRLTDKGKKTFVLVKRYGGAVQPSPRKIGEYGVVSLDEARETAREWTKLIKIGKDPAVEERHRREQEKRDKAEAEAAKARADANTFAAAFELFCKTHLYNSKKPLRTGKDVEQTMRRVLLPAWGSRSLAGLTRKDVSAVVYTVHDGGAPIAANRLLAYIKTFDAWAVNRSLIDAPFAALMKKPAEEVERSRVLTNVEIRALWAACAQMGAFGRAVRLLLTTAARLDEVSSMTWDEVDRVAGVWTLPRSRTKADRAHPLPLSALALAILDDTPEHSPFVFTTTGRGPLKGWSKAKARIDRLMVAELRKSDPQANLEGWRLHDLRRSAATGMAKLGTDRVVISKVLNHAEGGVTARYDRYGRDSEMVAALDAWGAEIERIVAGPAEVVVPMVRGGRK
jgi:integrase